MIFPWWSPLQLVLLSFFKLPKFILHDGRQSDIFEWIVGNIIGSDHLTVLRNAYKQLADVEVSPWFSVSGWRGLVNDRIKNALQVLNRGFLVKLICHAPRQLNTERFNDIKGRNTHWAKAAFKGNLSTGALATTVLLAVWQRRWWLNWWRAWESFWIICRLSSADFSFGLWIKEL